MPETPPHQTRDQDGRGNPAPKSWCQRGADHPNDYCTPWQTSEFVIREVRPGVRALTRKAMPGYSFEQTASPEEEHDA